MKKSIGALEFRSISKGIEVSNEVVKKAFVEVSYLKSICPGKFFLIVNGDAGEVKEAIEFGEKLGEKYLVGRFIINSIHHDIINALKGKYSQKNIEDKAIGIMETGKVSSGILALDKTLKSSEVNLVKLQLAFGIGGKLVYIVSGDLSSVENGMREGQAILQEKDIINVSVIPFVHSEIAKNLIK